MNEDPSRAFVLGLCASHGWDPKDACRERGGAFDWHALSMVIPPRPRIPVRLQTCHLGGSLLFFRNRIAQNPATCRNGCTCGAAPNHWPRTLRVVNLPNIVNGKPKELSGHLPQLGEFAFSLARAKGIRYVQEGLSDGSF